MSKRISRRWTLGLALPALASAQEELDDSQFRHRVSTVDALFERAQAKNSAGRLSDATYRSLLELLREQEVQIAKEAAVYKFQNLQESNYWHRGRLKFPTLIQIELLKLDSSNSIKKP